MRVVVDCGDVERQNHGLQMADVPGKLFGWKMRVLLLDTIGYYLILADTGAGVCRVASVGWWEVGSRRRGKNYVGRYAKGRGKGVAQDSDLVGFAQMGLGAMNSAQAGGDISDEQQN